MENDKKTLIPEVSNKDGIFPEDDITGFNLQKVEQFIEAGLPGIGSIPDGTVEKMIDLYLSGKTYSYISQITKIDKTKVMYLSKKMNWCKVRQEYLVELEENMKKRIVETKLESQDFLINLIQMYQKRIGKKVQRYLTSGLEEHADAINLKEVDKYLKIVEALKNVSEAPRSDTKTPLVGLNLTDGATITRKSDNEIEITAKQKATGEMLKQYADLRRKEESDK